MFLFKISVASKVYSVYFSSIFLNHDLEFCVFIELESFSCFVEVVWFDSSLDEKFISQDMFDDAHLVSESWLVQVLGFECLEMVNTEVKELLVDGNHFFSWHLVWLWLSSILFFYPINLKFAFAVVLFELTDLHHLFWLFEMFKHAVLELLVSES